MGDPSSGGRVESSERMEAVNTCEGRDAMTFDVKAAREEVIAIDQRWESGDNDDRVGAHLDARALLDRALDALAAGWEPAGDVVREATRAAFDAWGGDRLHTFADFRPLIAAALRAAGRLPAPVEITGDVVERACETAWASRNALSVWQSMSGLDRSQWRGMIEAALRSAGRPSPAIITDEVVEEAAKLALAAPWNKDGDHVDPEQWADMNDGAREFYLGEARAVLEYAASRGVAPASPIVVRPSDDTIERATKAMLAAMPATVDTGAEERLMQYRCAALVGINDPNFKVIEDGKAGSEVTPEQEIEIRKLNAERTAGEWHAMLPEDQRGASVGHVGPGFCRNFPAATAIRADIHKVSAQLHVDGGWEQHARNAAFIAGASWGVPALLSELDALRARIAGCAKPGWRGGDGVKALSPAEVEIASASAVAEAVAQTNERLTRGHRWNCVNAGIGEAVAEAMRAAGWCVVTKPSPGGDHTILGFSAERRDRCIAKG